MKNHIIFIQYMTFLWYSLLLLLLSDSPTFIYLTNICHLKTRYQYPGNIISRTFPNFVKFKNISRTWKMNLLFSRICGNSAKYVRRDPLIKMMATIMRGGKKIWRAVIGCFVKPQYCLHLLGHYINFWGSLAWLASEPQNPLALIFYQAGNWNILPIIYDLMGHTLGKWHAQMKHFTDRVKRTRCESTTAGEQHNMWSTVPQCPIYGQE